MLAVIIRLNTAIWDWTYAQSSNLHVRAPRGAGILGYRLVTNHTTSSPHPLAAAFSSFRSVSCLHWPMAGLMVPLLFCALRVLSLEIFCPSVSTRVWTLERGKSFFKSCFSSLSKASHNSGQVTQLPASVVFLAEETSSQPLCLCWPIESEDRDF